MKRDELRRYLAEQAECLELATSAYRGGPDERHRMLARAFGVHEALGNQLARALIEAEEVAGLRQAEGLARGTETDLDTLAAQAVANDEEGR